jgi:hypothetical protein
VASAKIVKACSCVYSAKKIQLTAPAFICILQRYKQKETNFYCEYCNVWMANHTAVKANHDSGAKHKANVAKSKSKTPSSAKLLAPFHSSSIS